MQPATSPHRPAALHGLLLVLSFQGLSGLAGGFGLIADPSGEALGIPVGWLEGSPFADYLVPGIVLLTLLGVGPLFVVYGLWTGRRWAWTGSLLVGLGLLVWLAVQVAVVGYRSEPPLQAVYAGVGVAMVGLTLTKSVREHLRGRPPGRG